MSRILLRPWSIGDAGSLLDARRTTPDLDRQFADDFDSEESASSYILEYLPFDERMKNWAIVIPKPSS